MGAQFASLRDGVSRRGEDPVASPERLMDSPAVEQRRVFIDAHGNLQTPGAPSGRLPPPGGGSRSHGRDVELGPPRASGFRSGGGFRTLSDLPPEAAPSNGQNSTPVAPGWRGRLQVVRAQAAGAPWWDPRFMLRGLLFPATVMRSVQGVFILLQIVVYLASCWLIAPRAIVTPESAAMWKWGSPSLVMNRCMVMVGGRFFVELRRLVVPMFLHKDPAHIALNIMSQFTSGPAVLEYHGAVGYTLLFVVSGVCGVLVAGAFSHIGVGASTACYGLSGGYIAQIWLLWPMMPDEPWRALMKALGVIMCISTLLWEIARWSSLDHLGHFGGLASGFLFAVVLAGGGASTGAVAEIALPPDMSKRRLICGIMLAFAVIACVVKLFFVGSDFLEEGGHKYTWQERCDLEWLRGYSM